MTSLHPAYARAWIVFFIVSVIASCGLSSLAHAITPTTTAVSSSSNPSFGGESVTFTATVTGAGGTPTGNVTFSRSCEFACGIGFQTIGTVTVSGGQAATGFSSSLNSPKKGCELNGVQNPVQ